MDSLVYIDAKAPLIEELTGHIFTHKRICVEAVQMAAPTIAAIYNNSFEGLENNKRLAVLGDAVLATVLCKKWYEARNERGSHLSLAQWTELRSDLTTNDALAQRGYDLGIDQCIITAHRTAVSPKMVATALEGIIGAVYQDGGDAAIQRVMQHLGFFNHRLLSIPPWLPPRSTERGRIGFSYQKADASFCSLLRLALLAKC